MRNGDYMFFAIWLSALAVITVIICGSFPFPDWIQFWWILFAPMVVANVFFPNSKFGKWLGKSKR